MAVSVIETIKSRANSSNTAYIVVVKLLCDDYSDLPTQSGLSGYELAQGCIAHVINENKDYMIDNSGNWHVYGGDSWTNVYTKSETDALLDDKQDTLTTAQLDAVNSGITAAKLTADEAAIVDLVDGGAKNHCTMESGSNSSSDRWVNIPVSDVGVGQWVMSFGTLTSTDTDDTLCQAICFNSSSQQVSNWANFKREANTNKVFTTTDNVAYVRLYPANSYATSAGDTVTFTNAMLCTKAAWDISHKFVPYCPSMRKMYDMILALQ